MLCQNCGKNEVNFHYTQVINGVKKEMALCDKCAKSLGLESLDFNMPINFSNFLEDFFGETEDAEFLPSFVQTKTLQCDNCKTTYDEFIKTGKFGCSHCYDVFSSGLNNVLKNLQSSDTHVGRKSRWTGKLSEVNKPSKLTKEENKTNKSVKKQDTSKEKLEKLNMQLKEAIKDERYEDAAKIRDEIKKIKE